MIRTRWVKATYHPITHKGIVTVKVWHAVFHGMLSECKYKTNDQLMKWDNYKQYIILENLLTGSDKIANRVVMILSSKRSSKVVPGATQIAALNYTNNLEMTMPQYQVLMVFISQAVKYHRT